MWKSELWRHADDEPTREGAVKRLVKMLKDLIAEAEAEGLKLAPFIGIACPGVINEDGSIEKGAQNLPGNWESSKFNLPASLVEGDSRRSAITTPRCLMHNDGVVQGLSEVPFMQDVERWGVLTIGTGLGNARFTNRRKENGKDKAEKNAKDKDDDEKDEKKAKKGKGLDALHPAQVGTGSSFASANANAFARRSMRITIEAWTIPVLSRTRVPSTRGKVDRLG